MRGVRHHLLGQMPFGIQKLRTDVYEAHVRNILQQLRKIGIELDDLLAMHRKEIIELNAYLPKLLKDIPNVSFIDIGPKFLDAKGHLSKEMMPDTTHPSTRGHEIWAEAIVPTLKQLMGKK